MLTLLGFLLGRGGWVFWHLWLWLFALPAGYVAWYFVDVFVPGTGVVRNRVTDPYSVSLSTDSARSYVADLDAGRFENPCPVCGGPMSWARVPEDAPVDPRSSYAASKVAQEHYAAAWARQGHRRTVTSRERSQGSVQPSASNTSSSTSAVKPQTRWSATRNAGPR